MIESPVTNPPQIKLVPQTPPQGAEAQVTQEFDCREEKSKRQPNLLLRPWFYWIGGVNDVHV